MSSLWLITLIPMVDDICDCDLFEEGHGWHVPFLSFPQVWRCYAIQLLCHWAPFMKSQVKSSVWFHRCCQCLIAWCSLFVKFIPFASNHKSILVGPYHTTYHTIHLNIFKHTLREDHLIQGKKDYEPVTNSTDELIWMLPIPCSSHSRDTLPRCCSLRDLLKRNWHRMRRSSMKKQNPR